MGLVFDEAALQPLATVDVDEQRARLLPEQRLQGWGVDDGRAWQLFRRGAAVQVDAIAIKGKQRGLRLCTAQPQAQRQRSESGTQQVTSGTRHGVWSL
ncbi:hypothetical protein D3C76_1319370 [compost metagenome]